MATYINKITDIDDYKSTSNKSNPFSRPSPFLNNNYMDSNPYTDRSSNINSMSNLHTVDENYRKFENTDPIMKDYSHLQYRPNKYEEPLEKSSGYDKFRYKN